MTFYHTIFYLIISIHSALAVETALKNCPTPSEEQLTYVLLQEIIKNPACEVRTISDFLVRLPQSFRDGHSLMYKSNSIQGPNEIDYLNPRAIVFGTIENYGAPKSKLIITFNGEPNQAGYNSIEIMEIVDKGDKNPQIFQFSDIQFPNDEKSIGNKSWEETQNKITFSKINPDRCIACHGEPAHPIFPGYPDWEGAYGSSHLGSKPVEEENGFEKYLEKKNGTTKSRYQFLGDKKSNGNISKQINGESNLELNRYLGDANAIRVARLLSATPEFNVYKYALLGAFYRCDNLPSFIPEPLISDLFTNIETKLDLKKSWTPEKIKQFNKEISDNDRLFLIQPSYRNYMKSVGNDERFLLLELDTMKIQEPSRADPMTAQLRLLLEGRGLSMDHYFMDLMKQTYRTHNGGYSSKVTIDELIRLDIELMKEYTELSDSEDENNIEYHNKMCKRLQTSSVNSLKNIREKKRTSPTSNTDNNKDIQNIIDNRCNEQASIDIPKGNSLDVKKIIDETSKSYLEKNQKLFNRYCLECHGASQPVINLPLESLDQMANYRPILGTTTPLQRLEMKSMPPSYSSLKPSDEERQQMIEILSELKSK